MMNELKTVHHQAVKKSVIAIDWRVIDFGAIIFVALVAFSLISIAFLARNIFAAAQHLETVKRNGETVSHLLSDIGVKRKVGKSDLSRCQKNNGATENLTWGPCWADISGLPEIVQLVNPLEAINGVFGISCDGSDESIGRIVIERGTPWFSAGTTGVTYAASDVGDVISSEVPMRVQVCNRWGEGIKVLEFKF